MKHRIRFLLPLLLLILLFALVACGETPTPEPPNNDPSDDSGDNTPSDDKTPVSKVFEGIAFPDKTVTQRRHQAHARRDGHASLGNDGRLQKTM